jgi:transposase
MSKAYGKVAGIDVHKRVLVVVILDSESPDRDCATAKFGTTSSQLRQLAAFLRAHEVRQVAMESTAQYWRGVWMELEAEFDLKLAQARSTQAPRGRKWDLADARRIAKRLLADDLTVSYVPPPEQRDWRLLARARVTMVEQISSLRGQIEVVLEQAQIKLTSVVSDALGVSGRRILKALIGGEQDPAVLSQLGHCTLRATREQLSDALCGRITLAQRLVLKLYLEQIEHIEQDIAVLEQELARQLSEHQAVVVRLCGMPGFSACAAQTVIAEIGPTAAAFASSGKLASWIGACPGQHESGGEPGSGRSAKGNRMLRRLFCQIAWAAAATKGSEAQRRYQRLVVRKGPQKAIWAVAHYMIRVTWRILHDKVDYIPPDTAFLNKRAIMQRTNRLAADLRRLGYTLTVSPLQPQA